MVLCAWAISVPPFTEICGGTAVPTNGAVTAGTTLLNIYWGTANGRVLSMWKGMGTPSDPGLCGFRFDHQRKAKNAMMTAIASPPITPPAILPVLEVLLLSVFATEPNGAEEPPVVLLLSVFATELDCAEESSVVVLAPGTSETNG